MYKMRLVQNHAQIAHISHLIYKAHLLGVTKVFCEVIDIWAKNLNWFILLHKKMSCIKFHKNSFVLIEIWFVAWNTSDVSYFSTLSKKKYLLDQNHRYPIYDAQLDVSRHVKYCWEKWINQTFLLKLDTRSQKMIQ